MRLVLVIVVGAALAACAVGARAQAGAAADGDVWGQLLAANNLEVEGKTPFDLAMTFQLYDLNGKPTVTGSVEEWWAAQGSPRRIVVHLAGLNEDGSAPEGADAASVRDAYLVRQLLEEAVAPVPMQPWLFRRLETKNGKVVAETTLVKAPAAAALTTKRVKLGKVVLDCTAPVISSPMNVTPTTLCVEPQMTNVLVLQGLGGKETVLRPRTGMFHDTHVALELKLSYMGKDAIAGTLATMKVWDPASSEIKGPVATAATFETQTTSKTQATSKMQATPLAGGVIAGNRTSFVEPQYPDEAKIRHASGAVLLNAIIGEDGKIDRVVPIASTDPMFTESAMQAVRRWTYSPYLLNGEPTKVDTTITVNFQLNPY